MCDSKLHIWITVQAAVHKKKQRPSYPTIMLTPNKNKPAKTSYVLSDKRYALRCFLKTLKDLIERNAYGSLFHSVGPYTENARS